MIIAMYLNNIKQFGSSVSILLKGGVTVRRRCAAAILLWVLLGGGRLAGRGFCLPHLVRIAVVPLFPVIGGLAEQHRINQHSLRCVYIGCRFKA